MFGPAGRTMYVFTAARFSRKPLGCAYCWYEALHMCTTVIYMASVLEHVLCRPRKGRRGGPRRAHHTGFFNTRHSKI
eukprot:31436-Eustigmatos_ZCMA.PRE.1